MEENTPEFLQASCWDGINCSINVSLLDVKRLGEMNQCHLCIGIFFPCISGSYGSLLLLTLEAYPASCLRAVRHLAVLT